MDILASVIFNSLRLTEPPYQVNSVPSGPIVLLIKGIEIGCINNERDRSFPYFIINKILVLLIARITISKAEVQLLDKSLLFLNCFLLNNSPTKVSRTAVKEKLR